MLRWCTCRFSDDQEVRDCRRTLFCITPKGGFRVRPVVAWFAHWVAVNGAADSPGSDTAVRDGTRRASGDALALTHAASSPRARPPSPGGGALEREAPECRRGDSRGRSGPSAADGAVPCQCGARSGFLRARSASESRSGALGDREGNARAPARCASDGRRPGPQQGRDTVAPAAEAGVRGAGGRIG